MFSLNSIGIRQNSTSGFLNPTSQTTNPNSQTKIIKERNKNLVGSTLKVIYDDIDYDKQAFVGRTSRQAPDIDNVVLFGSEDEVCIGEFYNVKITGTHGIDLVGEVEK